MSLPHEQQVCDLVSRWSTCGGAPKPYSPARLLTHVLCFGCFGERGNCSVHRLLQEALLRGKSYKETLRKTTLRWSTCCNIMLPQWTELSCCTWTTWLSPTRKMVAAACSRFRQVRPWFGWFHTRRVQGFTTQHLHPFL